MRSGITIGPGSLLLSVVLLTFGCAANQPEFDRLVAAEPPAMSPERAAAVADIRRKAEAARLGDTGAEQDVYRSYGPSADDRRTYAEIRAIKAELDALAAAARQATDPGELAALRKRAAQLEALRREVELDGDAGSGSINQ